MKNINWNGIKLKAKKGTSNKPLIEDQKGNIVAKTEELCYNFTDTMLPT